MKRPAVSISTAIALVVMSSPSAAPQIPEFAEVTGHEFGRRVTQHHEMVRYLETLAETSDRVRVIDQGETWEHRVLLMAVVTSPENHARLEEIRLAAHRLADPRTTSPDQAAAIIGEQPVIVWYGGSIHGFELSGSEGVLKLLEHLTTRSDPATREVLRNAVILIDPMLNPDGRDAFARLNHENTGRVPNPAPEHWSNDFDFWQALKFRTGHYFFDTNRDWFAHTQRETQARAPTLRAWRPQVVIDMHEMGSDVEFYFDPATEPYGPFFPDFAYRWFVRFGQAYAAAFDSAGFEYMTRERYNYFYPGYTTSYGSYQGAVGMLYEQGSSRGLALERPDGSVRRLVDALEQQYLAAWTAARTAARERESLLREYYEAHRAAIADGRQGIRRYLIAPRGDPALIDELADLLIRNGIEVSRLERAARLDDVRDRSGRDAGRREFAAGTYVIEAAQPRNRLIRTLLEPEVPLPMDFLAEARERIERAESPRFYDITSWSLPLLFNVGGFSTSDARDLPSQPIDGRVVTLANVPEAVPSYAYLIDGRQAASMSALFHLKDLGYRVAVIREPTRIGELAVPGGTVIVRTGQNDETIHEAVRELAGRFALQVYGVDTGLSDAGFPALGSGDAVTTVKTPRIAVLAEYPIHPYSFGWAWYTLDRQYEIPVTVMRTRSIAGTQLAGFNVLVVPSANASALKRELDEEGIARLKSWVDDGGTLVTLGEATDFARTELELTALRSWYDSGEAKNAQHFTVPGTILRVTLDENHWLSSGYESPELPALIASDRIYLMPEGPPSARQRAAARYAPRDVLRLSGHAWKESLDRMAGSVFVYEERVGQGRVIAFAEDPNFRAYARGTNRLFLNAVVLGPSAP